MKGRWENTAIRYYVEKKFIRQIQKNLSRTCINQEIKYLLSTCSLQSTMLNANGYRDTCVYEREKEGESVCVNHHRSQDTIILL